MKLTKKQFSIIFFSLLWIFFSCQQTEVPQKNQDNPSNVDSQADQTKQSSGIVFARSEHGEKVYVNGEKKMHFKRLNWSDTARRMIELQQLKGDFQVRTTDGGTQQNTVPVIGFRVEIDILRKVLLDQDDRLKPSISSLYLIPAVRPCDIDEAVDEQYSTILIGASAINADGDEVLLHNDLYDYFKPCPDDCPVIPDIAISGPNPGHYIDTCESS